MKLTVNKNLILMPSDASISITKKSPVLNDDTGSFSYPFPVPTKPNEKALGWPGKLQRAGDIASKLFILEDSGIQVLYGEIDFDEIENDETGIVLKSGMTDFYTRMDGVQLTEIDFGSEWLWADNPNVGTVNSKIAEWDARNSATNSGIIHAPVLMNGYAYGTEPAYSNKRGEIDGFNGFNNFISDDGDYICNSFFMFQFKHWWMLRTMFELQGYTVILNEMESTFSNAFVMTKPIWFYGGGSISDGIMTMNLNRNLYYSKLMPDVDVLDYLDAVKAAFCVTIDIDERTREVSIFFNKSIFQESSIEKIKVSETIDWKHKEDDVMSGFALAYGSQDDDLANEEEGDIEVTGTVTDTLPSLSSVSEDDVYYMSTYDRYYTVTLDDSDEKYWKRLARLKPKITDDGEDETTIDVRLPSQVYSLGIEMPKLEITAQDKLNLSGFVVDMSTLYFSLYHGIKSFDSYDVPWSSAEDKSMIIGAGTYAVLSGSNSMVPEFLYDAVYSEFLNWHYKTRSFTKYLKMDLQTVVNLQWRKRYPINGVMILLDTISFDLPYTGTVKIEGYTG